MASPGLSSPGLPSSPGGSRFGLSGLLRPRSGTATRRDAPVGLTLGGSLPSPSPGLPSSPGGDASPGEGNTGGSYFSLRRRASNRMLDGRARSPALPTSPTLAVAGARSPEADDEGAGGKHTLRLVPHLEATTRSLHFDPVVHEMRPSVPLRVGRFNERPTEAAPGPQDMRIAFRSKVVSRAHAEIWCDAHGRFFVRDTRSSSGTFLNHIRLSGPGHESRAFPVKDGDIVQLGVDYQGGTEEMYRCVKMRVEINRSWAKGSSAFNTAALRQLRALGAGSESNVATMSAAAAEASPSPAASSVTDCCICLFAVTVCQALFIAPCSHVYHFKCIRPLLQLHHPGFSCPLCRTFADLEADVETDEVEVEAESTELPVTPTVDQALTPVVGSARASGQASPRSTASSVASASPRRRRSSVSSRRRPHGSFTSVPDAGEFEREIRRASLLVAGTNGLPVLLGVSGRNSRPASIRNVSMTSSPPQAPVPSTHVHAPELESALTMIGQPGSSSYRSMRPPSLSDSDDGQSMADAVSSFNEVIHSDDDASTSGGPSASGSSPAESGRPATASPKGHVREKIRPDAAALS